MNYSAIAKFVAKETPLLASVITPICPIAGMVVELIARLVGADPTSENDIVSKMQSDPDISVKLKNLEYQHEDVLSQNATSDRANAREREEKIVEVTGKRDWVIDVIAILVVIGFFILCALNYFFHLDDDHVIVMLIGQMSSGFMLCLSYYFGASNK